MKRIITLVLIIASILGSVKIYKYYKPENNDNDVENIVLIVGRANYTAALADVMDQTCLDHINSLFLNGGNISVIVNTADPFVAFTDVYKPIDTKGLAESQIDRLLNSRFSSFVDEALGGNIMPNADESDLIASLKVASDKLNGKPGKVLIVDSLAAQTSGLINLAGISLNKTTLTNAVDYIADENVFIDTYINLTNSELYWCGYTNTTIPQESFTVTTINLLIDSFWKPLLNGRVKNNVDSIFISCAVASDYVAYDYVVTPIMQQDVAFKIEFNTSSLGFAPDSYNIDEETAEKVLKPIITSLPDSILIVGFTATTKSSDNGITFSLKRAEAVKSLLVELGYTGNIVCKGVGSKFNDNNDIDPNGNLIPEKAEMNRKVVIYDMYSPEAEKYF